MNKPTRAGRYLATWRAARDMSRKDFAEKCEISQSYLSDIEHGKQPWSAKNIAKVSSLLTESERFILADAIEADKLDQDHSKIRDLVAPLRGKQ